MKIKVLQSIAGADHDGNTFAYGKGAEVDVPSPLAKSLIDGGLAESVEPVRRKKTKKGAETASLEIDERGFEE